MKPAVSGLGCVSVADLFHALRALGRPFGPVLNRQAVSLKKQQDKLQKQLDKHREQPLPTALQSSMESIMVEQQQVQKDEQTYHDAIERISQIIHPFTLHSQHWQTQRHLLTHLAPPLQVLWELAQTYNTQKAQKAIDTFEKQIDSFAQGIDAWRDWVTLALEAQTQDAALRRWRSGSYCPGSIGHNKLIKPDNLSSDNAISKLPALPLTGSLSNQRPCH